MATGTDPYRPTRDDRFTFGLWTVNNPGRDPFGNPVRSAMTPTHIVEKLSELGAWGVNFHDNDLIPFEATAREREQIVAEFKRALDATGMVVPMVTTNLFTHPIFRDGAFTSHDPRVRAFALQKVMRNMDLGAELGAKIYVFWGGREGVDTHAGKDARDSIKYMREAINFLCEYNIDQGYGYTFALEPKPNEPRGDLFLPTVGHALAFITTLDHPEMVGVNPEVAHERMAGLDFVYAVAQAIDAGKLVHIDLNDQVMGRYDQDFRFGQADPRNAFFLVKLLEDAGYGGPKHFDAHALRTEDEDGVWAFAAGCMRTYKILQEKARRFNADPEIQGLLAEIKGRGAEGPLPPGAYSRDAAAALKNATFDVDAIAARGLGYERLDQLTTEVLLGAR
ncbi:MAG TPA: xylose isomerase [Chloroflexota bacterium]|nr:xylose isomerase [Chloroflexota bacterium]